jgi:hypothetical protein
MIGIVPIFLPAYCPFFNPIEFFFSVVKAKFAKLYRECVTTAKDLPAFIAAIMSSFRNYEMFKTFNHCGYLVPGSFDPTRAFQQDAGVLGFSDANDGTTADGNIDARDGPNDVEKVANDGEKAANDVAD